MLFETFLTSYVTPRTLLILCLRFNVLLNLKKLFTWKEELFRPVICNAPFALLPSQVVVPKNLLLSLVLMFPPTLTWYLRPWTGNLYVRPMLPMYLLSFEISSKSFIQEYGFERSKSSPKSSNSSEGFDMLLFWLPQDGNH